MTEWSTLIGLRDEWQLLLQSCESGVIGPDLSCGPAWAEALAASLLEHSALVATVLVRDGKVAALLPAFRTNATHGLRIRKLKTLPEAHGGRAGLLGINNEHDAIAALLDTGLSSISAWDVFQFSVVAGSECHKAITEAARVQSLRIRCLGRIESPFIELSSSWPTLLATLPKKLRWTLKKCERDLVTAGRLEYEEVISPDQVDAFLAAVREIELSSWKEKTRTSITSNSSQMRFYEALIPIAARDGLLHSHVLKLDGRPIAYILGFVQGDVFLDQKESYVLSHADNSPGHVLKRFAIPRLIDRGVRLYDFMGSCEPYKMRWTDKTYCRLILALYADTLRGNVAHLRARLSGRSKSL